LPTQGSSQVSLVTVSGESRASNFELGDVDVGVDPGFLALAFGIEADLDDSNPRPDTFSLSVEVSGLSDAGALAAAIPAGVGRMLAAQVGGERARIPDNSGKHGISLWARTFNSKSEVSPEHEALDFGDGGHFDFEQRTSGVEAGLDFRPADSWRLGALLFDMQGTQRLDAPGAGRGRIDGDGYGIYAGWASPTGLHFDGAWRRLRYEAEVGGDTGRGRADSLDLQAGKAWTTKGGMRLEPQLQFTHARIDGVDGLALGGTAWAAAATNSDVARLGVALSRSFGSEGRVWTPFMSLSAVHEFDGDSDYAINGDFHGRESTGGSSARGEAGFDAALGALSLTGAIRWQDGDVLQNAVDLQFNLRYRW
jgi:outer membrane autotransporter protein